MMEDLKNIIESLLFVTDSPLSIEKIKNAVGTAETQEIRAALNTLSAEYQEKNGGFHLKEIAGGFQFRTRPEFNKYIRRMIKPNAPKLSKAALETLAIIAYKQPVIRSDVEHIRGVDCGGIIRTLLERKLVRILGRKEIPGRPLIYATTKLFLEVFDLKNLKDLPTPKEIEALGKANAGAPDGLVSSEAEPDMDLPSTDESDQNNPVTPPNSLAELPMSQDGAETGEKSLDAEEGKNNNQVKHSGG